MASTDATSIPVKNQAYRVTFPIFDADGDLVTGAAGLDTEVSKDGGTFADCTNEATEIATSSGMYYIDLTATEMNADTVALITKTSTTGAKTTPTVLYPQEAGDIKVNVTYWNGTAVTAPNTAGTPLVDVGRWLGTVPATPGTAGVPSVDAIRWATQLIPTPAVTGVPKTDEAYRLGVAAVADLPSATSGTLASATGTTATLASPASTVANFYNGALLYITGGVGAGQVRRITGYTTGRVATVAAWATAPDNTSTYEVLPDYVLIADYQSGLATAAALAVVQSDTDDIQARLPAALVSGRIDASVGAMAANTVTAAAAAADLTTELQTGLATAAALTTAQADLDDIQARLPAALISGRIDANVGAMAANTMTAAAAAADLTTELQTGLATSAGVTSAVAPLATAAGLATATANLDVAVSTRASAANLVTAQADLDDIQTRIPAALVSGRMSADAVAISGSTVAADAVEANISRLDANVSSVGGASAATIAGAVWNEAGASHVAAGSFGKVVQDALTASGDIQGRIPAALVSGRIDASVGVMAANVMTAAAAASDLTTELQTGLATAAGVTAATANLDVAVSSRATAAAQTTMAASLADLDTRLPAALVAGRIVADAVAISGSSGAADGVEANVGNLDVPVSSRSVFAGGAVSSVTGAVGSVTGNVGGSVDSVVTGVTVATVADKTGYALSAGGVDAIWDEPIPEPAGVFDWASATARKLAAWGGVMNKNKKVQTSALLTIRNDADTAALGTATATDSGGVATKGKVT